MHVISCCVAETDQAFQKRLVILVPPNKNLKMVSFQSDLSMNSYNSGTPKKNLRNHLFLGTLFLNFQKRDHDKVQKEQLEFEFLRASSNNN